MGNQLSEAMGCDNATRVAERKQVSESPRTVEEIYADSLRSPLSHRTIEYFPTHESQSSAHPYDRSVSPREEQPWEARERQLQDHADDVKASLRRRESIVRSLTNQHQQEVEAKEDLEARMQALTSANQHLKSAICRTPGAAEIRKRVEKKRKQRTPRKSDDLETDSFPAGEHTYEDMRLEDEERLLEQQFMALKEQLQSPLSGRSGTPSTSRSGITSNGITPRDLCGLDGSPRPYPSPRIPACLSARAAAERSEALMRQVQGSVEDGSKERLIAAQKKKIERLTKRLEELEDLRAKNAPKSSGKIASAPRALPEAKSGTETSDGWETVSTLSEMSLLSSPSLSHSQSFGSPGPAPGIRHLDLVPPGGPTKNEPQPSVRPVDEYLERTSGRRASARKEGRKAPWESDDDR
eukprot:NODE_2259_length_1464_cov_2.875466_g2145_i0.p1 GENE.NODE_2259_length_1464_cov_2.875466_g2145_i0~~NODE_2259_length_1464_cov_2.875466_g2145_i0.p1  ORF type:complete len:410 (-),score=62.74 NODE_2259_length_1464_cov_2.875466_g2145_i0:142-1371(-)